MIKHWLSYYISPTHPRRSVRTPPASLTHCLTHAFSTQCVSNLIHSGYHPRHYFKILFSYLTHRQTCCHFPSRSRWGPSSHDWTLLSCGGTSPLHVRPTAEWLALETAAPLDPSRHRSRRWGNTPSGGGPGRDSREQQQGAEEELAHIHPARPGWSYPL